ncbi:ECF transporter S component [Eubacteriales bacterium OttesenSCG-928-N13]|nr:ECF transporter S component [Eubacteriales bacterium OttesenSCG-928-N13]
MTATALFIAILLILFLTPLGLIPLGIINLTTLCIPVVAGTLVLGLKSGMVLGACFGTFSALSAFGILKPASGLAAMLVAESPILGILVCILPRLAIPLVTWAVYKLAARGKEHSVAALPFAAGAGSLTNTILYMGMLYLSFVITGLDVSPILAILATVAIGALGEAAVAILLSTSVVAALWRIPRR